jgi:Flp pilus assembly protein CpaB
VKRSNRLVILVGVLLAVLAFVAIVILLNQDPGDDDATAEPTTETVLVATTDIAIGDPVTPDVVEEREVPIGAVQQTPLQSTSQVSGQPALFALPAGSQVTQELIGRNEQGVVDLSTMLQPGEKAISFMVDPATGLDFLVQPGDKIDIIYSARISVLQETADSAANTDENAPPRFEEVTGLDDQRSVKAVLQNKRVLYVSGTKATRAEPQDTNNDGVVDESDVQPEETVLDSVIIVFAGTDQDAEVIKFAQNDFLEFSDSAARTLSVTIRHADDEAVEDTLGITIDQLVAEYGLRIPSIVESLNEDATPAP